MSEEPRQVNRPSRNVLLTGVVWTYDAVDIDRREGRFEWREYDVDTRKDTGRTLPGRDDCADPDYVSPSFAVDPEVKVEMEERSQLRFLSSSQWRESTRLETGR